jgi:hypothetical protein
MGRGTNNVRLKAAIKAKHPRVAEFVYSVMHFPSYFIRWSRRVSRFVVSRLPFPRMRPQHRYRPELKALIRSGALIVVDLVGDAKKCGPKCESEFIKPWGNWIVSNFSGTLSSYEFLSDILTAHKVCDECERYAVPAVPMALIAIPKTYDEYLAAIGPKSRNMLRKAERGGYIFRHFDYNAHLQDIYEINTSKESRGGRAMTEAYREYPQPSADGNVGCCQQHRRIYYGCFLQNKLVAYCMLIYLNDIGVINTILGHGAYLSGGIMNGLVGSIVKECVEHRSVKYINYLTLYGGTPQLIGFKRRVGFQSYAVFVDVQKLDALMSDPSPKKSRAGFLTQWKAAIGRVDRT